MKTEIKIEINFPDGKRTIEMSQKKQYDIQNCEQEKIVVLNLNNGESYTGIFKGIDGDDAVLGSISGKNTIGINSVWIHDYFEQN